MNEDTREAFRKLIDQVLVYDQLLASMLSKYLTLSIALGDSIERIATVKLNDGAQQLRGAVEDRARLETQLVANARVFAALRVDFDAELAKVEAIVAQSKAAAQQATEEQRRQTEIELLADSMSIGDILNSYADKVSLNAEGQIVASKGAQLEYRDRIILRRRAAQFIPLLKERQEMQIV
jgi:hypothetical protein